MIPNKIYLHNFMSYKNPGALDFGSFDLACLCGDNGCGKSTILEAITWALWNKARSSPDALIHHQEQGMWVDFEFKQDSHKYRIIRKRSRKSKGTSELDFLIYDNGWTSISGATIKETEDKIAEVLKLPYEIFINSAYLKQGHADEFSKKPPAQRKEVLGKILNLDAFELLSQKAREKTRVNEAEEEILQSSIIEIQENLKQKNIFERELKEAEKILKARQNILEEEEKKLGALSKEKNKFDLKNQKLKSTESRLNDLKIEGSELKQELENTNKKLKEIENLLKKSNEIEKSYQKLQKLKQENDQYNEKLSKLSPLREKLGAIRAKEEEIQLKISKLKKISTCPTCLRTLSTKEATRIIKDLQESFEKEINKEKKRLETETRNIGYDEIKHKNRKSEINQMFYLEQEKRQLDLARQSYENTKELNKKIKENLDKKRGEYARLGKERSLLLEEIKKLKQPEEDYLRQETKVRELRNDLLEKKGIYEAFKQRLGDLSQQEILFGKKKQILYDIKKQTGVYKMLAEIFSKKGLQTMIIETVLPEIEEETNNILEKITDGRMRVTFITSKAKKSGEGDIETLDIKIVDAFGERDYSLYSGGEAFRIDLAIRVALSKVLSKRAGTKLQFLAIDEGFGSLDQAGKDEVIDAITALKGDFEKILVVTHIQELKNLFPTRIEVTKDEEGSHLEVVSV